MNRIILHLGSNYSHQTHFLKPTLPSNENGALHEGLTQLRLRPRGFGGTETPDGPFCLKDLFPFSVWICFFLFLSSCLFRVSAPYVFVSQSQSERHGILHVNLALGVFLPLCVCVVDSTSVCGSLALSLSPSLSSSICV